ncbi:MAG: flavin reductase family protein [Rhizobiaceae bacterium]
MSQMDPRSLRNAFGSFMTGVTVVTTCDAAGAPVGFTANSFTSVSIDPPLLLVCPGKFLSTYEAFANCKYFAVNILSEGQESISNTFASFKDDRFAQAAHHADKQGVPLIDGALANFSCTTQQVIPAGDHCILIGSVRDFTHSQGRGLGYAGGQYFSLGLKRAALEQVQDKAVCGAIIQQNDHVLLEKTVDGFRPPQVLLEDRGRLRQALTGELAARGAPVRLDAAYSVFNAGRTHHAYFLATPMANAGTKNLQAVAISDLPTLDYTTLFIADMMARFAIESRTRSFALYLGDAERGDVHTLPERM